MRGTLVPTGLALAGAAGVLLLAGCAGSPEPAPTRAVPESVAAAAAVDVEACDRVLGSPSQWRGSAATYWPLVEDPDLKFLLKRIANDGGESQDWTSLQSLCGSYR